MLSNHKIKKAFRKDLEKPPQVDRFCEECGIEFKPQARKTKRKWWIPAVSTMAVSVAIVCGCIPLMLPKDTVPSVTRYGEADISRVSISEDDFLSAGDILLFNADHIDNYSKILRVQAIADSKVLGYELVNVDYFFKINNRIYAYTFDYRAYSKEFDYKSEVNYDGDGSGDVDGIITYEYGLIENRRDHTANISFEANSYSYFISLQGYDGMTEINKGSIDLFMQKAFGEGNTDNAGFYEGRIYS